MLLKLFALLRVPISVVSLGGFLLTVDRVIAQGFGAVVYLGLLVCLAVVSVKLYRARPGALQLAGWLVALETIGAVLFVGGWDLARGTNLDKVAMWAGMVVALWTLPNSLGLYLLRAKFVAVPETRPLPPIEARETARIEAKK